MRLAVVLVLPLLLVARARAAPPSDAGAEWLEGAHYGLRVEGVRTCAAGQRAAAGRVWVAAEAHVRTKDRDLFVTARDFTLERGGIILQARHVELPLLPHCLPLLQPSRLRARQSVRGYVLFEMPAAWTAARDPLVLVYKPTEWGGTHRIESRISPCLDACADTPSRSRPSNRSASASHRR
jgi:hypothetical protein